MNKAIFAVMAVGLMLASVGSGCIGGKEAAPPGEAKSEGKNVTVGDVVFTIFGKDSAGAVSSDKVVDVIKETITPETREDASKRQRTAPEFTFGINTTEPGMISKCVWDFGDGNTGEGIEAKYTYAAPGGYFVNASVTLNGGASFSLNITAAVNYRADGQDSIPVTQPTQTGAGAIDDQNDYTFPVGKGAVLIVLKTMDDPDDPPLSDKDNDVGLEVFDPKGASKGAADSGAGANEEVKVKKPKEAGNWVMRVGCLGEPGTNVYANTGPVSYFFSIDVTYA